MLTTRSGQSLLEAVIAIGVITVSTLGTTTLIITTTGAGRVSQDRVAAANFAREGIEVVRSIRDSNYLKRDQNVAGNGTTFVEWNQGLDDDRYVTSFSSQPPTLSTPLLSVCQTTTGFDCTGNDVNDFFKAGTYIKTREARGPDILFYIQAVTCPNGATCQPSKYSRVIDISCHCVGGTPESTASGTIEYLDVVSTVKWPDRTGIKTLVARERLYNWR